MRRNVAVGVGVMGVIAGTAASYRARHASPYEPVLERIALPWPSQPGGGTSLKVGFVTDTHIGPVMRPPDIERALELLCASEPDLLLLGGDYICESPRFIPDAAAVFGDFVTSIPFGAIAVLGNHDYSNDAPRLASLFERRDIRVLRNESVRVRAAAGDLWVAGIDDAIVGSPSLDRAFSTIPQDARALALWHEPDWAERVAPYGAFLQLSGHSHGGQIRLPFLGNAAAPAGGRRFVAGRNDAAGMPVYTSRGVGVFRPPVRLRCRPEVTLITLG